MIILYKYSIMNKQISNMLPDFNLSCHFLFADNLKRGI